MNRSKAAAIVLAMVGLVIASAGAQKPDQAQTMFEAARQKETLDGDLASAIKQYRAIVDNYSKTDRLVVATTLVRMAECYQKLGDAQARTIYERIAREFPDQQEAVALARARLVGTAAVASAKGDRAVWTGPKVYPLGRVSPDGRFIIARNRTGGNLMVHDVVANVDRTLTPGSAGLNSSRWTRHPAISRDGKQVVYGWWEQNLRLEFRIAALSGNGLLEPRAVFLANDDVLVGAAGLATLDWSPDGRWIAAAIRRKDRTGQIALIAVADGSFRVLKSMDWNVPETIFFSPDSKYIAYDFPAGDGIAQRDVFVLAIDGSREIPAVVHNANEAIMGWSPDGTRLLFASDRTGSVGLWALPFADGKAQGHPNCSNPISGGVSRFTGGVSRWV